LAIDADFCLAKSGAATALQFIGDVVGRTGVPEFIANLTLRNYVEVGALDV
jgi:hypothetical protein